MHTCSIHTHCVQQTPDTYRPLSFSSSSDSFTCLARVLKMAARKTPAQHQAMCVHGTQRLGDGKGDPLDQRCNSRMTWRLPGTGGWILAHVFHQKNTTTKGVDSLVKSYERRSSFVPQINCLKLAFQSVVNRTFSPPPVDMGFRLVVHLGRCSGQAYSISWRVREKAVSWANRFVGVSFYPAPPRLSVPPCAVPAPGSLPMLGGPGRVVCTYRRDLFHEKEALEGWVSGSVHSRSQDNSSRHDRAVPVYPEGDWQHQVANHSRRQETDNLFFRGTTVALRFWVLGITSYF